VSQERYFTEKEVGPERVDPVSGKPVVWVEEKNWFFRMSAFQDDLVRHIEAHPDWIVPETRRNEILGFLQKPLGDLSISRPRSRVSWGIPLPFDEEHVTYVWVDALLNYFTASDAVTPGGGPDQPGFSDPAGSWWPADLHLIGKDILTTHAVYWPTLLLAAGIPLPRRILAHGWWVVGDTKMSKSLGNVVDPLQLRETFGTDAVRWYLLREMPTGSDASYTPERFMARYDELANVLGNLAHRATSMIVRYRDGVVPAAATAGLDEVIEQTLGAVHGSLADWRLHEALGAAMELARAANGYIEEREPWAQAKDPDRAADLDETLATLVRALIVLSALFHPVCPEKSTELARRLGFDRAPTLDEALADDAAGRTVEKGDPLFPRLEWPEASE
jgi:methionyl-tRNA synthetase